MSDCNYLKYLVIMGFTVLVFGFTILTPVYADSPPKQQKISTQVLGEQANSSLDALKKADKYSFATGGIGILIAYGHGNGVSAEEIGDVFVKEIKRRGMTSRYFYYIADWPGMTVEYHIGYSALGPWSVDDAALQVGKAVRRAQAAQKVHND